MQTLGLLLLLGHAQQRLMPFGSVALLFHTVVQQNLIDLFSSFALSPLSVRFLTNVGFKLTLCAPRFCIVHKIMDALARATKVSRNVASPLTIFNPTQSFIFFCNPFIRRAIFRRSIRDDTRLPSWLPRFFRTAAFLCTRNFPMMG